MNLIQSHQLSTLEQFGFTIDNQKEDQLLLRHMNLNLFLCVYRSNKDETSDIFVSIYDDTGTVIKNGKSRCIVSLARKSIVRIINKESREASITEYRKKIEDSLPKKQNIRYTEYQREYKRKLRANMTPEERDAYNARQRELYANMTPEQREKHVSRQKRYREKKKADIR